MVLRTVLFLIITCDGACMLDQEACFCRRMQSLNAKMQNEIKYIIFIFFYHKGHKDSLRYTKDLIS